MHTYTSKTKVSDFKLYNLRIKSVNLKWCNQVLRLIDKFDEKNILDIGCCYFQLYKEIKKRKKKYQYFGIDIDKKFIKLGLKYFPELKRSYKICNFEKIKMNKKFDCSVISATLEHVDDPKKFMNNVFSCSKKIIILRTFFGSKEEFKLCENESGNFVNNNQFSLKKMKLEFNKKGFKVKVIKDLATKKGKKLFFKGGSLNRKFMVLVGIK